MEILQNFVAFNLTHRLWTHDGYFPILYCHNRIWYVAGLDLTKEVLPEACLWFNKHFFCRKNNLMIEILDKGLTGAKIGADGSAKNTANTLWFIRSIFPIVPEVWDIIKKLHWASVLHYLNQLCGL